MRRSTRAHESKSSPKGRAFEFVSSAQPQLDTKQPQGLRVSVLSRLNTIGVTSDEGARHNVATLVENIQRVRNHRKTSISERQGDLDVRSLTEKDISQLRRLCRRLVDYSRPGRSTYHYACVEIAKLCVLDAFICQLLLTLVRDWYVGAGVYDRVIVSLDDASLAMHKLWSGLLYASRADARSFEISRYLESKHKSLMVSLRNQDFSFLAARYLLHTLSLPLRGNDLFHIVKLWHLYMDLATRRNAPEVIEWSNLNDCFNNLPSDDLRQAFVSPERLASLVAAVFPYWESLQNVFRVFFKIPEIDYFSGNDFNEFTYTKVSVHKSHLLYLPSYYNRLLRKVKIRGSQGLHTSLRSTVFRHSLWNEYYEYASRSTRVMMGEDISLELKYVRCQSLVDSANDGTEDE